MERVCVDKATLPSRAIAFETALIGNVAIKKSIWLVQTAKIAASTIPERLATKMDVTKAVTARKI